jgi:TolB-like protein/DNA-binding winged helix-turn-helix (wHTH) protein/tetratricopeptide (TPR) repeat protein
VEVPARATRVRFGTFEVDLRAGELRKNGLRVKLQDQPFQILALLLGRPGEIITREELQRQLWPTDTFVDFDVGLNTAIKRLRDALGDSAENPRYIETVHRRGYRFVAPVEEEPASPPLVSTPPSTSSVSTPQPRLHSRWVGAIGFAAILTLVGLSVVGMRRRLFDRPVASPIRSIAVLPLESLSRDPDQEYFADGITEAIITDLGKLGKLSVISRTSVMQYKGTKKPLPEIARELQVDALVEGTVTRSGNRVRITANLVQASPEKHLWADSFERDLSDVMALQDDVSQAIVDGIQIRLTPEERARLGSNKPVDPAAYEAYLEGRYYWENLRGQPGKAKEFFKLAIAKDPNWALPYAGLAEGYLVSGFTQAIPNEDCRKAKTTALDAVKKDEAVPEEHTVLGDIEFWCEWDWYGAEREVRRAIEINPSFARAHSSYSRYLLVMGRTNEALAESKRAVELDPLAFRGRWDRWASLYLTGQYDAAIEQCRKIQEINNVELGHIYCGETAVAKGDLSEGILELKEAVRLAAGNNPRGVSHLGYAYAIAGQRANALKAIAQLDELTKQRHVHPVFYAEIYAGLGQKEDAFKWLEEAYRVRARDLLEARLNPQFATLRSDPRFADLLRRMGLPQ